MSECQDCIYDEDGITPAGQGDQGPQPGRSPESGRTEYFSEGRRKLARRAAIALGLGGVVALFTGKREAAAYWQVGWCYRYVCTSQCRKSEQRAARYRNESGAEWCSPTWVNTGVYWQENCCAAFGMNRLCCS